MLFKYAKFGGIIDWFEYTMDANEVIEKIKKTKVWDRTSLEEHVQEVKEGLDEAINQMVQTLVDEENEKPQIIRFFCIPNFENLSFDLYGVAKISNNGSTYIFGNNRIILNEFAPDGMEIIRLK